MAERPYSTILARTLVDADRLPSHERGVPLTPADDARIDELAAAATDGDVEAVGRLYDHLVGPIHRYVALRVRRREDAEDLTQAVFERIVTALPRYRHNGKPFAAWAFRIARNAVVDHVRRARPHESLGADHDRADSDGDGVETLTLRGEQIRELRRAIGDLTPDQQEAIALRYAAGLSADEAAQVMGRRAGTIRGLTFRAVAALRRRLGAEEETPSSARRGGRR